jgi:hypothetical protein
MPVGAAVAGPLADDFGTSPVLVVGGVLIVVAGEEKGQCRPPAGLETGGLSRGD